MKRIETKESLEKRNSRNKLTISIVLIGVMFFSVFAYGFMSFERTDENKKVVYNNYEFVSSGEFWVLNFESVNLVFKYNPEQVESVNVSLKTIENYNQKPLYIYSEDNQAGAEVYKNIYPFVQRVQEACLTGEVCNNKNLPVKICEDNFIIIKEKSETSIKQEKNCVFIEGKKEDLLKLSDEFLFRVFKIKQ